jgi:hypothetical protein
MNVLLILLAICFILPGLIVGLLRLSQWKRRWRGQRPPFSDRLLRSPVEGLRREIQDLNDEITAFMTSASIIPLLLTCIYLIRLISDKERSDTGNFLFILGIGFAGYLVWKVLKLIERRKNLRTGLAGERATGEELNRLMLDGYHVYHDFPAHRFNIDHILVGAPGVFAVETKAHSKGSRGNRMDEARVTYDGENLRFPSWVTTEPIDQAKAQAAWLSKWLSGAVGDPVKVLPMVTIPGWYIDRKSPNGVPVLNPKQVKAYLEGKKEEALSESMIKRICHQLEQKCRDVDLWDWY